MSDLLISTLVPVAPNTALLKMTATGRAASPYFVKRNQYASLGLMGIHGNVKSFLNSC